MIGASDRTVSCSDISKSYPDGGNIVAAISELSMEADAGTVTAVVGPSGSGKTTLLHMIGAVEHPDSGSIRVAGIGLNDLSGEEQAEFRAQHVSFVFADLNLLPVLSLYENIMLGLHLLHLPMPEMHHRATAALELVQLADLAHRLPAALSSGERQRAALARAVARASSLIIADEPTAHLDHAFAMQIATLLKRLATDNGTCVILATHDQAVAAAADQILRLEDGRLVS